MTQHSKQQGSTGIIVLIVALAVGIVGLGSLSIWTYLQYREQKSDVDGKIALAVADAEKKQAIDLEEKFFEREKEPNRQFVGPSDYGRLTFDYPKTWSVYIERDTSSGGTYSAYLNPISVPPVRPAERFALRVTIENRSYESVLKTYEAKVKSGDLKTSAVTTNGIVGTRIDGLLGKDIRGSVVVFKIRDKALTIRTDAEMFKSDFDKLVKTIEFNQ